MTRLSVVRSDTGAHDQVVAHPQQTLARDAHRLGEQKIVVLCDRAVQAILDGQNGAIDLLRRQLFRIPRRK